MIKHIKKERLKFEFYKMLGDLKVEVYQIGSEDQIIYRAPDGDYAISDFKFFEINYTVFSHYEHTFTKNEIIDMICEKLNTDNKKIVLDI